MKEALGNTLLQTRRGTAYGTPPQKGYALRDIMERIEIRHDGRV